MEDILGITAVLLRRSRRSEVALLLNRRPGGVEALGDVEIRLGLGQGRLILHYPILNRLRVLMQFLVLLGAISDHAEWKKGYG